MMMVIMESSFNSINASRATIQVENYVASADGHTYVSAGKFQLRIFPSAITKKGKDVRVFRIISLDH